MRRKYHKCHSLMVPYSTLGKCYINPLCMICKHNKPIRGRLKQSLAFKNLEGSAKLIVQNTRKLIILIINRSDKQSMRFSKYNYIDYARQNKRYLTKIFPHLRCLMYREVMYWTVLMHCISKSTQLYQSGKYLFFWLRGFYANSPSPSQHFMTFWLTPSLSLNWLCWFWMARNNV